MVLTGLVWTSVKKLIQYRHLFVRSEDFFHSASFQYLLRCCDTRRAGIRFSEDPETVRDLVNLEEDHEEDVVGVDSDPLTCVRRAVSGMLHAEDDGIVS